MFKKHANFFDFVTAENCHNVFHNVLINVVAFHNVPKWAPA